MLEEKNGTTGCYVWHEFKDYCLLLGGVLEWSDSYTIMIVFAEKKNQPAPTSSMKADEPKPGNQFNE